ncbi:hypothetical protein ASPSYDRAFT_44950 [Aspergillus sydowii CBS 593.65]|uniref:Uncharacterized protein n=1 Tax=Aspergillus sydowii CBS 593.65 TaxID=1036612 RepID=A0A1L9TGL5_9EURO|nr:uncharacterized protein ASPSYDRAFT_44950 [Aspergillus sydowii CBS 593.65]OJJ58577.1 hypothetical protein ASPSYDRAFT_44950 [Aspergillus sydowii CBS 593.65]
MPHITLLLLLLFHTFFISAQSQSNRVLLPGFPIQTEYTGEIVPRRLFDNFSACTASDTCGECFGLGYVLCDDAGCFNPDDGEQCCKGGAMCVGRDDSCCEDGPGKAGKDGVVSSSTSSSSDEDDEDEDDDDSGAVFCDATMTGEECCSQGGKDIHWCSGEFPANQCYDATEMTCCEDGHVCAGDDCCDIVDSKPTTPWASGTAKTTDSSPTSTPTGTSEGTDESGSESENETETTGSSTVPTPSPTDAAEKLAVRGTVALIGAVAVGMLVL